MITQRNDLKQDLSRGSRFNIFSLKDHAIVRNAVAKLTGHEHTVIVMRFWEQNTISEIAEILGITWEEVEKHLESAMENLKQACLQNEDFSRGRNTELVSKQPHERCSTRRKAA